MKNRLISTLKKSIVRFARLLWENDLVSACSGNISVRVDSTRILITATGTSFYFLKDDDIVLLNQEGEVLQGRTPSSEIKLHLAIYNRFPAVSAVLHTHTTCTNAFFLDRAVFRPVTFEAEHVLGKVRGVPQRSMNVRDARPVLRELERNRIVALRRHGVVSVGEDLCDCFFRVQLLEEQIRLELFRRVFLAQGYKVRRPNKRSEHG